MGPDGDGCRVISAGICQNAETMDPAVETKRAGSPMESSLRKLRKIDSERRKLDKEEKAKERALAKQHKEDERTQKRLAREQERVSKEAALETARLRKLATLQERKAEKLKAKEDAQREKQARLDAKDEEQRRKQKSQPRLFSYFKTSPVLLPSQTDPPDTGLYSVFLPFSIRSNVTLHPLPTLNPTKMLALDRAMECQAQCSRHCFARVGRKMARGCVKDLIALLNHPLTPDPAPVLRLLNQQPQLHLQFAEDVRPPYSGTFSTTTCKVTGRRPFGRDASLNYDHDSEAEWQELEEGEELLSEDDESVGSEDAAMNEFLDDEGEGAILPVKQKGELVPFSVGPCWEDHGLEDGLENFRLCPLGTKLPIDPLAPKEAGFAIPQRPVPGPRPKPKAERPSKATSVPEDMMADFIQVVEGQVGTVMLLRELLKQK